MRKSDEYMLCSSTQSFSYCRTSACFASVIFYLPGFDEAYLTYSLYLKYVPNLFLLEIAGVSR